MMLCAATLGCTEAPAPAEAPPAEYLSANASVLSDDIVQVVARARGTEADATDYALCVAAYTATFRGMGYARHLRTTLKNEGGVWAADALYTLSPSLPEGIDPIDAQAKVADCEDRGIPTV